MRTLLQGIGVTLGFITMFFFAIAQIVAFQHYGLFWAVLMWIPFVATMWLLGRVFPFD
jgi:hypothetical protein